MHSGKGPEFAKVGKIRLRPSSFNQVSEYPFDIVPGFGIWWDPVVLPHRFGAGVVSGQRQVPRAELIILLTQVPGAAVKVLIRILSVDFQLTCGCGHQLRQSVSPFMRSRILPPAALLLDKPQEQIHGNGMPTRGLPGHREIWAFVNSTVCGQTVFAVYITTPALPRGLSIDDSNVFPKTAVPGKQVLGRRGTGRQANGNGNYVSQQMPLHRAVLPSEQVYFPEPMSSGNRIVRVIAVAGDIGEDTLGKSWDSHMVKFLIP